MTSTAGSFRANRRGWLENSYYVDAPVNPVSNSLAGLAEKIIARAIRNVSVGPVG